MTTTTLSFRTDKKVKKEAEILFHKLGLNMSTALNLFLYQAVQQKKIPFEIGLYSPNQETIAALKEAEEISKNPHTKKYDKFADLLYEVKNDL